MEMVHPRGFTVQRRTLTSPTFTPTGSNVEYHVVDSDIIFVFANTPSKTHGLGAGKAAYLTYV
ncbi:UDP-glucose 6-dehydrogenase 1 [Acorus calamus]|uniref:UDP-glucose 6-dehydrogenase 1 n=1 Tax=Acorus calamus TaxID=4465 RepID=A0AAV9C1K4_ACOCL|nr:UDP-glucose 6-dehydrogenase 1 [Acorus calamus]